MDAIESGARAIVERAARAVGVNLDRNTPTDELKAWAKAHPAAVARSCRRWWEKSARAWARGNNSGDNAILAREEENHRLYANQAETVAAWCGITEIHYPGLYPCFRINGHNEYFDGIEQAFHTACATHRVTRDGIEQFRSTEVECMAWIHKHHSYSVDHATKYEGYAIEPLP